MIQSQAAPLPRFIAAVYGTSDRFPLPDQPNSTSSKHSPDLKQGLVNGPKDASNPITQDLLLVRDARCGGSLGKVPSFFALYINCEDCQQLVE